MASLSDQYANIDIFGAVVDGFDACRRRDMSSQVVGGAAGRARRCRRDKTSGCGTALGSRIDKFERASPDSILRLKPRPVAEARLPCEVGDPMGGVSRLPQCNEVDLLEGDRTQPVASRDYLRLTLQSPNSLFSCPQTMACKFFEPKKNRV